MKPRHLRARSMSLPKLVKSYETRMACTCRIITVSLNCSQIDNKLVEPPIRAGLHVFSTFSLFHQFCVQSHNFQHVNGLFTFSDSFFCLEARRPMHFRPTAAEEIFDEHMRCGWRLKRSLEFHPARIKISIQQGSTLRCLKTAQNASTPCEQE